MNVGCWKRQCCFQQPHGCILTSVRQFLPISRLYMADSADQLNPTTCSATKYPLRITKRPIDPRKFNARDMAFLRTSL